VGNKEVLWECGGEGPIPGSEWVKISTVPGSKYLLIRSDFEDFPDEALFEIRQERMVTLDEDVNFPPCRVEIVLGMEGRFFVILPTGINTKLPFACNAPFVQDPARVTIKSPSASPTNRWLLNRIGQLASEAMIKWLKLEELSVQDRCEAYRLLPDVDPSDNSPEGVCANVIRESFVSKVEKDTFLFAEGGKLTKWKGCVAVPNTMLQIWSPDQVSAFFVDGARPILANQISHANRQTLVRWGCVEEIDKREVLRSLRSKHLPKPETWEKLLLLWAYVSAEVTNFHFREYLGVKIVPVQGQNVLHDAEAVVRMGEKRILQSQDDWDFLFKYLLIADSDWFRFLPEQRRQATERKNNALGKQVKAAFDVLEELKLHLPTDTTALIEKVGQSLFAKKNCEMLDCIRLTHLAAALNARVSDGYQYFTQNGERHSTSRQIVVDLDRKLDLFVDPKWYEGHVLHADYFRNFSSCTATEFKDWVLSGHAKIRGFVPFEKVLTDIGGQEDLQDFLEDRGGQENVDIQHRTDHFIAADWNFATHHWNFWYSRAQEDAGFWGRLFEYVLRQPINYWSDAASAEIFQIAKRGHRHKVSDSVLPGWVVEFRNLPCIPDTWGAFRQPAELLRRTPQTESLLDVEPFVRADIDTESTRPLLKLLGVRDTPTGPDRLLERIASLSKSDSPPIHEVEKWYHRLDQMACRCSTNDLQKIKDAFHYQKIVFTDTKCWAKASEIFLAADEEGVPGAAVVYPGINNLALWRKIGIAERPTADLAIAWLKNLPSREVLVPDELRRIRSVLPRFPDRIWNECGHWLNLENEWMPIEDLVFAVTMQSLVHWKNLFSSYKQKTADFRKLSDDISQRPPFSELPTLATKLEDRFNEEVKIIHKPEKKPWIFHFGSCLKQVILENDTDTTRVREVADRLSKTLWQIAESIQTTPYIDGVPVGTPRDLDVVWQGETLYVLDKPITQLFKKITQELGRPFDVAAISEAVWACIERSAEFVNEYLENNFNIDIIELTEIVEKSVEQNVSSQSSPNSQTAVVEAVYPANEIQLQNQSSTIVSQTNHMVENQGPGPFDSDSLDFQEASDEADEKETESAETQRPEARETKPPKPSLIERFALGNGFSRDGDTRYFHSDGRCLEKTNNKLFPWELRNPSGELIQSYWLKDSCIQQGPLQIDAEIWMGCDQFPQKYTVILSDYNGYPVEYSGNRFRQMRDSGELTLYPASYRLVYGKKQGA
jgi:hypothetical protein